MLHVQSISAWAPSCIGPYSQATSLAPPGLALLAGQIGLDPASMRLVPPPAQPARCLASCQAVAVAARTDLARALLGCTVYCAGATRDGDTGAAPHDGPPAVHNGGRGCDGGDRGWVRLEESARLLRDMLDGRREGHPSSALDADSVGGADDAGRGGNHSGASVPDDAGSSGEEGGEVYEDGESITDEYLRPPAMPAARWDPLLTYVVVPGLPKGADVELHPLVARAAGLDVGARPGAALPPAPPALLYISHKVNLLAAEGHRACTGSTGTMHWQHTGCVGGCCHG